MCRENLIDFSNYEIYEDGRIWSNHWKRFLEGTLGHDDYIKVHLKCKNGVRGYFFLHRVIWYFFKGDIPENMQVNHIDEDKSNNALSNLNLMTPKDNVNWGTCIERRAETLRNNGKNKGENHPFFGKKRPEHGEAMKGENNPIFGTHRQQETKNKISAANSKELYQLSLDGKLLAVWKNSVIAANTLGLSKECIRYCCQGKQEKHGGFKWKYHLI